VYNRHVRSRQNRSAPSRGFFRQPRGFIDWPRSDTTLPRAPVHLVGWCLFPGTSVARVEVSLNGGAPQRARIAMERPDVEAYSKHPDAPVSGFEHKVDLTGLPEGAATATIQATAHSLDGRTLQIEPAVFAVGPAEPAFRDTQGAAAELRARSMRPLLQPRPRPQDGVHLLAYTHMLVHGGGSLYLLELLRRLRREPGFRCEVVTLADGPLREDFERDGIPVHVTDGFPVASVERYEGYMAELVAWAAAGGFNAVLANTLGSFAGADLATRLQVPCVWAVHESFELPMFWHTAYEPGMLHPYVRAQAEQALRSAAAVVFEAEATRRLFLPDADAERLVTLPYGIELEAIDASAGGRDRTELRRRLGIDPDARVLLCLGSIEPRKAQAMLAGAFAQVSERHPDAQLVLVGETDHGYSAKYTAALHEYIARAGLAGRVRVEPVTDDPYSWHAVADLLVCASDVESLPRAILEAMALGKPVLSTRVYGVPDLIDDGRTGYLCDMRDAGDLARGLDRVLSAPRDELQAVGAAASEHVRKRHDPAAYAAQVAALLEGLVAEPRALPSDVLAGMPQSQPDARATTAASGAA
jgi:glycosyltransferase involved in cell wall biosynthesis